MLSELLRASAVRSYAFFVCAFSLLVVAKSAREPVVYPLPIPKARYLRQPQIPERRYYLLPFQ
jgi:hypothetical protein